ncbi:hypothetical protein JI749_10145 [Devosia oryziradicis]|uniref:HEPN AbiJ-N-terminal domain-containing protein n=1 Tax=Devosia oryziradicis TaxID=2801335 RepID=A0ABX7BS29_9HYPH|nr:hypothetical protein [Devosia oryziradicis]QQR34748.1 hypothetical protein JI749_10145 [Devosia oryziradicis]
MTTSDSTFSHRFGFRAPDAEITVREDAPPAIRDAILMLGYSLGFSPKGMRDIVCAVMLRRPDSNNWSEEPVEREVHGLVDDAPWFRIYDLAERLYQSLQQRDSYGDKPRQYEEQLNAAFCEHGIGWKMEKGQILVRGSEAFELATATAPDMMRAAGAPTASNEMHQALIDISRRPEPDVTGAIQHAMAALECVARGYEGTSGTLGSIISRLPLPKPMDEAVRKLWGFASEQGRHILEGRDPAFEEAELVVTTAAAVSVYLIRVKARTDK